MLLTRLSSYSRVSACINDEERLKVAAAERDILAAGEEFLANHDGIGVVLLERMNMVPYAPALSQLLLLPDFSIYTFVTWFHSGLVRRDFGHPASAPGEWRER
jgi:hypothetical protein